MTGERVIYNGVSMSPEWPACIEAAQRVTTFTIGGRLHERIPFGSEADDWGAERGPCGDCGVLNGQLHVECACDVEQCPCCEGQVLSCDCEFEGDDD